MKKIVVTGPESTGKSTLCAHLANHYQTLWCPEYAREYLLNNGITYSYDDLLTIAQGQINLENEVIANAHGDGKNCVFLDTDLYVIKVWCEYVFGKCHQYILDQISQRQYDYYLLPNIDLPWTKDELREYPDEQPRRELFEMYKDILTHQNTPWSIISGTEDQRTQMAITQLAAAKIID